MSPNLRGSQTKISGTQVTNNSNAVMHASKELRPVIRSWTSTAAVIAAPVTARDGNVSADHDKAEGTRVPGKWHGRR